MTSGETVLAVNTLDAFLRQVLGWKYGMFRAFAPANTEQKAAELIVSTADAYDGDVPGKEHAAAEAVYKQICDAGYGGQVTSSQCAVVAHSVYQAVLKSRGR